MVWAAVLSVAFADTGIDWVHPPVITGGVVNATIRTPPGLKHNQLTLHIDGSPVTSTFSNMAEDGTTTLMAFDSSGSFKPHVEAAFSLAREASSSVSDSHHVSLMIFGRQQRLWAPTAQARQLADNLREAKAEEAKEPETRLAASLLAGIDALVEAHPQAKGGRRRLLVFTDAGEESTVFDPADVIAHARARQVSIDVVVFAGKGRKSFATDLDRISRVARETGGRVVEQHDQPVSVSKLATLPLQFRVSAAVCGSKAPVSLTVTGPHDIGSAELASSGSLSPCGATTPATTSPAPSVVSPEPAAARSAAMKKRGFGKWVGGLCLLSLLALAGCLAWVGRWLIQRTEPDREPTVVPSSPAPTAQPSAPDPITPDPVPAPVEKTPLLASLPETHLVVVQGDLAQGTRWRFAGRILRVGANDGANDIVVDLPQISGEHARFELDSDGSVTVTDLGSSNGTWIDDKRLIPHETNVVRDGSVVHLSSQLTVAVRHPGVSS